MGFPGIISPLYMNFVTLLSTGFWLHPCSGYTLPNYHRSIQSRGLHLPAPRVPEATWDDWTQDLSRSLADKKWGSLQFSGYQYKILYKKTKDLTPPPIPSHPSNCWEGIWTLKYTQKNTKPQEVYDWMFRVYSISLGYTPKRNQHIPDFIISHFF